MASSAGGAPGHAGAGSAPHDGRLGPGARSPHDGRPDGHHEVTRAYIDDVVITS